MAELAPRPQRKGKNRRGPRLNTNQLEVGQSWHWPMWMVLWIWSV